MLKQTMLAGAAALLLTSGALAQSASGVATGGVSKSPSGSGASVGSAGSGAAGGTSASTVGTAGTSGGSSSMAVGGRAAGGKSPSQIKGQPARRQRRRRQSPFAIQGQPDRQQRPVEGDGQRGWRRMEQVHDPHQEPQGRAELDYQIDVA